MSAGARPYDVPMRPTWNWLLGELITNDLLKPGEDMFPGRESGPRFDVVVVERDRQPSSSSFPNTPSTISPAVPIAFNCVSVILAIRGKTWPGVTGLTSCLSASGGNHRDGLRASILYMMISCCDCAEGRSVLVGGNGR